MTAAASASIIESRSSLPQGSLAPRAPPPPVLCSDLLQAGAFSAGKQGSLVWVPKHTSSNYHLPTHIHLYTLTFNFSPHHYRGLTRGTSGGKGGWSRARRRRRHLSSIGALEEEAQVGGLCAVCVHTCKRNSERIERVNAGEGRQDWRGDTESRTPPTLREDQMEGWEEISS